MAEPQQNPGSGNSGAKTGLGIVFLTIFIDLVGFSIIFPLFPDMLDYYLDKEAATDGAGLLSSLLANIPDQPLAGGLDVRTVLFGGVLGSLYSLLQFIFSPIWGGLSDRIGRRRVLQYTVASTAVGYALWVFSGNFWLLVLSRVIAGIASGNIAVATAAVADLTSRENRSKGMALVGIAFGLGFVVGPAIGGLSAAWSADWDGFGLNPFSFPALISLGLALLNLLQIQRRFKETLPDKVTADAGSPPARDLGRYPIFSLLRAGTRPIMLLCLLHLIFFTVFSGMEFTLTFLAKERLGFDARFNGYMFIVIGITMILVQGILVRRLAKPLGESKLTLAGILFAMAAFWLLATAPPIHVKDFFSANFFQSQFLWGLVCMSCAIGLVSPCISALVSLHSPADQQGRNLGLLRSAGALARVIGPVLAASLYFMKTAELAYKVGACILTLPFVLTLFVKSPSQKN